MELREIFLVILFIALSPLMIYSDGGIKTDYRLARETLTPISETTSLNICRTKVKYYHYCRYHVMNDKDDVIFRYKFLSPNPVLHQKVQYLRSAETGEITTNIGLKYFWHRVFLIALLALAALINGTHLIWKHYSYLAVKTPTPNQYRIKAPSQPVRNMSGQVTFGKK